MPHINPKILYDALNRHQMRLYDIYLACVNIEISDLILSEREYIIEMMQQIEKLI
jgi:hypothetical protein